MALKPCRECNKKVSTEASVCPLCGVPNPTEGSLVLKKNRSKKSSKPVSNTSKSSSNLIGSFWEGKVPLGQSFWGYGVGVNLIALIPLFYANLNIDNLSEGASTFLLIYFIFYIVFYVWVNVGIWKSATNYAKNKPTWGTVAKVVVVLSVLNSISRTFI